MKLFNLGEYEGEPTVLFAVLLLLAAMVAVGVIVISVATHTV